MVHLQCSSEGLVAPVSGLSRCQDKSPIRANQFYQQLRRSEQETRRNGVRYLERAHQCFTRYSRRADEMLQAPMWWNVPEEEVVILETTFWLLEDEAGGRWGITGKHT